MARVVVGLSGGVDSSVSAYLLQEQGHEVIGVFMKNWHDESVILDNECPWIDDSNDALLVAEKLGVPFQVVDLSEEYKQRIVDYMFDEYEAGRTPNPDVLCNREIKFDAFLEVALGLGAEFVATGHYCQKKESVENGETVYHLIAGADQKKDQSYFLCQINQDQLSKALFPIGHLQKSEVRQIAHEQDLITAGKKDSQGLCFVGKISLPEFLQQKLSAKKGKVLVYSNKEVESQYNERQSENLSISANPYSFEELEGKEIGEHNGAHFYTIGQRKGLGIGGTKEPLFVIGTNTEKNEVYVGEGEKHLGLYRPSLKMNLDEINWLNPNFKLQNGDTLQVECRIRYRQPLVKAELIAQDNYLYLKFEEWQRGITPGQFAAWYKDGELLGSGVIL